MSDQDKKSLFNRKIADNVRLSIKQQTPTDSRPVGKRLPMTQRSTVVNTTEELIKSKLVKPKDNRWLDELGDKQFQDEIARGQNYFDMVSDDSARTIREVEDIMGALPDTQIAERILVNSIISPNDLISKEISYISSTKIFGDVTTSLIEVVKDYFTNSYKIQDKLSDILSKALFREGSYIMVVLPESSIDDAINSNLAISTETRNTLLGTTSARLGYIGESRSIESTYRQKLGYSVSDNFEIFKVPTLERRTMTDMVAARLNRKILTHGKEGADKDFVLGKGNNLASIYPERTRVHSHVNLIRIKELSEIDRPTVGHPIVIDVPVEAFIPVYVPGEPKNHVGGFILLDSSGNPVTKRETHDQYRDLNSSYKATFNDVASGLVTASADRMMEVDSSKMTEGHFDHEYMGKVYAMLFEQDLKDKLRSGGIYTSSLDLDAVGSASRIMFARACSNLETKVVFVPKELFSFLAFDYKQNGLGRSLLERGKALSSLRMVQEMADALANVRNAIDHKDVTFNLDPADPNPMKTMTEMLHSVQRSTRLSSPIGLMNFADIAMSFHQAGWNVKTQGHEGMPDMSIDFNQTTRNYPTPDKDYSDRLKNQHLLSFGLSPDSVSSVMGTEFATSIVSANVFLAQDALEKQSITCSFLSDFIIKYTRNSSILMERIIGIIKENRSRISAASNPRYTDEILAHVFVNNLKVELPKPDMSKLELQSKALDTYISIVEKVVPVVISTELFTSENVGEELSQVIDEVRNAVQNMLIRDYMIKEGILPELFSMMFTSTEELDHMDLMMRHQQYISSAIPNLVEYVGLSYRRKLKEDKKMQAIKEELETRHGGEDGSDDYDDSDSDYDSDDDDKDDDSDGGGDDDGFDSDDFEDTEYDIEADDADDPDKASDALDDMLDDLDDL